MSAGQIKHRGAAEHWTTTGSNALEAMIETDLFLEKGGVVCDAAKPARYLYTVRAGTLKECIVNRAGRERIIDFYFPGEIMGLDALSQNTYRHSTVSIEKSVVCRISLQQLLERIEHVPGLQRYLLNLMSRQLLNRTVLDHFQSAEQKLAAFLMALSRRFAQSGRFAMSYRFDMSRHDIAGYLQLTTETVSRIFTRFKRQGLITVDKKQIMIHKPMDLMRLAA